MTTQNLTRGGAERNQKKAVAHLSAELGSAEISVSADDYELHILPANALVRVSLEIVVASDAATSAAADIGFSGGSELLSAADLKSAAGSVLPAVVSQLVDTGTGKTLTFTPTYVGAPTVGTFRVTTELVEYTKNNGEYVPYSET